MTFIAILSYLLLILLGFACLTGLVFTIALIILNIRFLYRRY